MTTVTSRRNHIYHEAAILFHQKGYAATSMRELAEKVGLEVSSLYSHIRSKEEILHDICLRLAQRFIEGLDLIENAPIDITSKLRKVIHLHISLATEDIYEFSVFHEEWRNLKGEELKSFMRMRRDYEGRLVRMVELGIATQSLRHADPRIVIHTLLSSIRWVPMWYHEGREMSIEQLADNLSDVLLYGINKQ